MTLDERLAEAVEQAREQAISDLWKHHGDGALARYGDLRAAQGRWVEHKRWCAKNLLGNVTCETDAGIEALLDAPVAVATDTPRSASEA